MTKDTKLQRDVLDELDWEPSVNAAEIGVTAHNGVVTLTGYVPTYSEKLTAEKVAKRVLGVKGIANEIEVRFSGSHQGTDTDLAEAAINSLKIRTSIPEDRIKVSVSKGWVTLEGNVDWNYQKEAAEDIVAWLHGVRGVVNQITVKPRASALEVKDRIEAAFRRHAELDAKKIRVETHDGKVTLRGELPSWAERQAAARTAWAAPGVTHVENLITVSSD